MNRQPGSTRRQTTPAADRVETDRRGRSTRQKAEGLQASFMRSVTIDAFAKINLTLGVLGARPDGLHDVRTVLHTIDLHDRITCLSRPGPLRLRCRAAEVPDDRTNLVWRAAEALWRVDGRRGEPHDLSITVVKRIPPRAGLGGGSSDAAATLVALTRLWNLDVPHQALTAIAASLGADVPFFLCGGAALGLGRGDEIYPLADLPPWPAVLIVPPFGVSTGDAYRWRDDDLEGDAGDKTVMIDPRLARTWLGRLSGLRNDLERPVARRHPEIAETIAALQHNGAMVAAMSGSGSATYGLFATEHAAVAARRRVRLANGWTTRLIRLLPRATFQRRVRPRLNRL